MSETVWWVQERQAGAAFWWFSENTGPIFSEEEANSSVDRLTFKYPDVEFRAIPMVHRDDSELTRLYGVAHCAVALVSDYGVCGAAEDNESYCTYDDCTYCALARVVDSVAILLSSPGEEGGR